MPSDGTVAYITPIQSVPFKSCTAQRNANFLLDSQRIYLHAIDKSVV